jgi:aryl-alcohol dehydrogenase-like predicted oxidoreductase
LNSEKRIKETVEALKVELTEEECRYLEEEYRPREWQM